MPIFHDIRKLKHRIKENGLYVLEEDRKEGLHRLEFNKPIDVICGGFPCQDISVAGKKEGIGGQRSGLWKEFKRLIKEIKPRYAIIENVANLRTNGLTEVLQDLWSIGYCSEFNIISARSVGAPHLRERIWIIAHPKGQRLHRRLSIGKEKEISQPGGDPKDDSTPDRDHFRLWQPFASEKEKSEWWAKTTAGFRSWWETEPRILRVSDGLSKRMDKSRRERIKALGNSVVPQIPELIGRAIMERENEN